jgi:hypothetical protein
VKKLFGIDEKAFMNMPSINDRINIEFDEMDDRKLGIMVGFTEAVLKSLCQIVYPADSNKLAASWTQESRTITRHCRYSVPTEIRFLSTKTKRQQQ